MFHREHPELKKWSMAGLLGDGKHLKKIPGYILQTLEETTVHLSLQDNVEIPYNWIK